MRTLLAGKPRQEATTLLLQHPGVRTVSLSISGQQTNTLPTGPQQIRFLILEAN